MLPPITAPTATPQSALVPTRLAQAAALVSRAPPRLVGAAPITVAATTDTASEPKQGHSPIHALPCCFAVIHFWNCCGQLLRFDISVRV